MLFGATKLVTRTKDKLCGLNLSQDEKNSDHK